MGGGKVTRARVKYFGGETCGYEGVRAGLGRLIQRRGETKKKGEGEEDGKG